MKYQPLVYSVSEMSTIAGFSEDWVRDNYIILKGTKTKKSIRFWYKNSDELIEVLRNLETIQTNVVKQKVKNANHKASKILPNCGSTFVQPEKYGLVTEGA